jgi:hypothetical protein
MVRKSLLSTLALLGVTAMVMPAFGKPFEKTVTFGQTVKVGTTQLDAGNYKVMVDGSNVKIEKGHTVVAQTEGQLEQRNQKFDETAVIFTSNGEIQEIDFGGQNQALVINHGS